MKTISSPIPPRLAAASPGPPRALPAESAMPDDPEPPAPRRDFAALYRDTVAPLRRYLARLLGNRTEAQDVAHDAYLRVYPSADNPRIAKPEALLYTTARRLAINRLKRRSIAPFATCPAPEDAVAASAPGVAQQVIARQELSLLEAALADLPEGCRAVLLLRKVELLSHREIADRLGIAISTVEKQHARALRLLRTALPAETHAAHAPAAERKALS
ncbi:MAG: sigma-70 family RNA polymerase sigma factor [Opitutaceae bacterium]|nr:sigma-70 family RNA polymerase sigma factor [Opitutaceae bacterium]